MLTRLRRLRSAIILYRADIPFFEEYVGKDRVRFVPHGVDTDFFRPAPARPATGSGPRLLVSGQFGRDFKLLRDVFRWLAPRIPGLGLDLVGAHHAVRLVEVKELAALPNVLVHPWVADERLLALYQSADLLVLSLSHCGANNALVEALACGLPMVATDVGGVRDYGGGRLFPITPPGDVAAMAGEIEALLNAPEKRQVLAANGRRYAEEELTWRKSAQAHLDALQCLGAATN